MGLSNDHRHFLMGEACLHGHLRALQILLKQGANPNAPCFKSPESLPLHEALKGPSRTRLQVLSCLLKSGADVNALPILWISHPKVLLELTPFLSAEVMELLAMHGLELNQVMKGQTLWDSLSKFSSPQRPALLKSLLKHGLTCQSQTIKPFILSKPLLDEWDLIVQNLPFSTWEPVFCTHLSLQLGRRPFPFHWLETWKASSTQAPSLVLPFCEYFWWSAMAPKFHEDDIEKWLERWEALESLNQSAVRKWIEQKKILNSAQSHVQSMFMERDIPSLVAVQTGFNWLVRLEQKYRGVSPLNEQEAYHKVFDDLYQGISRFSDEKFQKIEPLLQRALLSKTIPNLEAKKAPSRL